MHVTVSSCTNHISRYICRQKSKFPRYGSLILLVNLRKGMQSSSEQPLVREEHCVTTLITAAKETTKGHSFLHILHGKTKYSLD